MFTRRSFVHALAAGAAVPALRPDAVSRLAAALPRAAGRDPAAVAQDEDFWAFVQDAYDVDRTLVNLNNGGVAPAPRTVMAAMRRYLDESNNAPAMTMWAELEPRLESVRVQLAARFGCDPEELAITRNTSESLENVQLGLPLKAGDEVVTTTQDYPRMITTWQQRARREGIVLKQITFPVPPPSLADLADRIARAITPKTRVIHICHITNLTGQIFPVRDICRLARARGIEVVVDGAHAFAHFPFTRDELECDYYGTSLHKWLSAPIGTGFLYVRKEKIPNVWPLMAAPPSLDANIRKFEEIGTHPAANHDAIAEAVTFYDMIGAERKAARLRFLRARWTDRLGQLPGVKILTSPDPAQSCGICSFTPGTLDVGAVTGFLWDRHRIIVTPIGHPEFKCIRVTPNVYTTLDEVDRFADVMTDLMRKGLPK